MPESIQRILTALAGAPIVIGLVYLGSWPLTLLVGAAALFGQREIYRLLRQDGLRPAAPVGYLLGGLLVFVPIWPEAGRVAVVVALLALGLVPFRGDEHPLRSAAAALFGVLYPPVLLSSVLYLRIGAGLALGELNAFFLTTLTLVLVWVADIGAYYAGKAVGKHPLAPTISPNKTWEGFFGGIAATLVVASGASAVGFAVLSLTSVVGLALVCAVTSPIGDLLESRFKRSVHVKDAGKILPGHGGMMDRIDGLIYAVPIAVLYLRYVVGLW